MTVSRIFFGLLVLNCLSAEEEWTVGTPEIHSTAIEITTDALSQMENFQSTLQMQWDLRPQTRQDEERMLFERSQISSEKGDEESNALFTAHPNVHQSGTKDPNFLAVTSSEALTIVPDANGAVGPAQYIAFVNGRVKSFNKTTGMADGILNISSETFFKFVLRSGFKTSDPRIRYDRFSNRWYVIMLGYQSTQVADDLLIAVSDGGTISKSTVWKFYAFTPSLAMPPRSNPNDFADFPTLGIDVHALYIGVDVITQGRAGPSDVFVVNKANLLKGILQITTFRNVSNLSTPQGVDNFDRGATEGYFIGLSQIKSNWLVLKRIANPGGTPSISGDIIISVPSVASASTVPHKGNTGGRNGELDTLDLRLCHSHIRDKHLYTAHNLWVDSTGFSSVSDSSTAAGSRFYEIDLTNPIFPVVLQSPTLYGAGTDRALRRSYWIPSVMTNGLHHIAMGFSTAGQPYYIDAGYIVQFATDSKGTLPNSPILYTRSSTSYNPPANPGSTFGRRWGDFSTTSVDPTDNMTLWTIQEFCSAENVWGCQVVSIPAPPPPSFTISPTSVAQASSVDLIVAGTSVKGSAFYDPPADFSKHLSVALGDCKINSVQVLSPTRLKVNVSTLGRKGKKTMIVTNPDGQKSTSANAITIKN